MKTVTLHRLLKAQEGFYGICHEPRRPVRASTSSCFLAPVVGIPNCLQASFNTGTVSFPRVPFCRWALSSSSGTSTLGFFSAPAAPSAGIYGRRLEHWFITEHKDWLVCLRFNFILTSETGEEKKKGVKFPARYKNWCWFLCWHESCFYFKKCAIGVKCITGNSGKSHPVRFYNRYICFCLCTFICCQQWLLL